MQSPLTAASGFERKTHRGTAKRDYALAACIVGAILLIVLLILPLAGAMRSVYTYHGFVQELADSFVYGKEHKSLTVSAGDGKNDLPRERAERLFSTIVDTGMGHPQKEVPDAEGIIVEFGDGCSLSIWPVEVTERGRVSDTGVLFRFERADDSVYMYDTDLLEYEKIAQIVTVNS